MSDLLTAIQKATTSDLESIRARIDALSGELDSLRAAARIVEIRLNGKPAKKPRPKKLGVKGELKEAIYDCIAENGPGTAEHIALKIGSTTQAVAVCVARSDWFKKLDSGKIVNAKNGDRL
jgi:hypothetical protein